MAAMVSKTSRLWRVGLAYRIGKSTVNRSGYGIFFELIKGGASGTEGDRFQGFNYTTNIQTTYQGNGATPYGAILRSFPRASPDSTYLQRQSTYSDLWQAATESKWAT